MQKKTDTTDEILEIWDWNTGKPTGNSVPRKHAHLHGIAHESVHLWIYRISEKGPEILFQHRADFKDSYPDCLDITVAGHVPFGLKKGKLQKEALEEIGISPDKDMLVDLGFFRYEEKNNSIFHREFQHIYVMKNEWPLNRYKFNDGEVTGIYAVPLDMLELFFTKDLKINVEAFDGHDITNKILSKNDFHPLLFSSVMDHYMKIVIEAVKGLSENALIIRKFFNFHED